MKTATNEKEARFIDIIITASLRAADLTSKLLSFARKGKIVSAALNVHNVVDETLAILQRTIDKRITISLKKAATNFIITGDASGLQNAFMNICINACHAMPEGGDIVVSTKNVRLNKTYCDASPFDIIPGEYFQVEIKDTGCGIPLENIKKIFEPFFTTKAEGKGTGLGLAAVKETVIYHRGAVNVYSELGIGTSFHILLPCSEDQYIVEDIDTRIITGTGKILLVDDEELIRITGKQLLEDIGYTVLQAENGNEALEMYKKRHAEIDLVLMDMIMPGMSGREVFYKMKEINPCCLVIISSGFSKEEDLAELQNAGLCGFIGKPYRDFELSQLIAKALHSDKSQKYLQRTD